MLRTTVRLGTMSIDVEAETLHELLREASYIQELDASREGDDTAEPFYRERGGFDYFGFRRPDGAEVLWGQHKKPEGPGRLLFAYYQTSDGYRGWERYDSGRRERIRLSTEPAERADAGAPPPDGEVDGHRLVLRYINEARRQVPEDHRADLPGAEHGRRTVVALAAFVVDEWERIRADRTLARFVATAVHEATGIPLPERARLRPADLDPQSTRRPR